jgi:hypothetical protein
MMLQFSAIRSRVPDDDYTSRNRSLLLWLLMHLDGSTADSAVEGRSHGGFGGPLPAPAWAVSSGK